MRRAWIILSALVVVLSALSVLSGPATAHPEDEFCTADGGIDPALCRALQDMDRAGSAGEGRATNAAAQAYTETEAIDFERPALETFALYVKIGAKHILPGGLDHILFVLALFFSTRRLKPLLIQISAFTLAHTLTLGLVAAGVFAPSAALVEPLIAATIAFVAIENLIFRDMTRWRPLIVFAFGLIHGMGFAGFFGSLGLPDGQFWSALIGFNVGVELGQLVIILAAALIMLALRQWITEKQYRRFIVWPACSLIGLTGTIWTVERLLTG